ncbi:MAG: hypothetical protein ABIJ34_02540 [archaeon]
MISKQQLLVHGIITDLLHYTHVLEKVRFTNSVFDKLRQSPNELTGSYYISIDDSPDGRSTRINLFDNDASEQDHLDIYANTISALELLTHSPESLVCGEIAYSIDAPCGWNGYTRGIIVDVVLPYEDKLRQVEFCIYSKNSAEELAFKEDFRSVDERLRQVVSKFHDALENDTPEKICEYLSETFSTRVAYVNITDFATKDLSVDRLRSLKVGLDLQKLVTPIPLKENNSYGGLPASKDFTTTSEKWFRERGYQVFTGETRVYKSDVFPEPDAPVFRSLFVK